MSKKGQTRIGAGFVISLTLLLTLAFNLLGCEPQNIKVDIVAPLQVAKGEEFVFEIHVENTAEESQLLYSIDISEDYIDGIAIQKTEPPFVQAYHIPVDNTQSYEFKNDIAPKGNLVVKFFAVGVKSGDYASEVDICINTGTNFITYPIRTIVTD